MKTEGDPVNTTDDPGGAGPVDDANLSGESAESRVDEIEPETATDEVAGFTGWSPDTTDQHQPASSAAAPEPGGTEAAPAIEEIGGPDAEQVHDLHDGISGTVPDAPGSGTSGMESGLDDLPGPLIAPPDELSAMAASSASE